MPIEREHELEKDRDYWKAKALNARNALESAWQRGVGFVGLPGFNITKDIKAQSLAFDEWYRGL